MKKSNSNNNMELIIMILNDLNKILMLHYSQTPMVESLDRFWLNDIGTFNSPPSTTADYVAANANG